MLALTQLPVKSLLGEFREIFLHIRAWRCERRTRASGDGRHRPVAVSVGRNALAACAVLCAQERLLALTAIWSCDICGTRATRNPACDGSPRQRRARPPPPAPLAGPADSGGEGGRGGFAAPPGPVPGRPGG